MNIELNDIIIGLGIIALIFLFWKEWVRQPRKNLFLRLLASALAILALVELIIPVKIQSKLMSDGKVAIIRSEGFTDDSIRNFIEGQFRLPTVIDAAHFPDLADSGFQSIHLFGYGMKEGDLKLLRGLPLHFHPGPIPGGIVSVTWNKKLTRGRRLVIQGHFLNNLEKPVRLLLTATGNRIDSAQVGGGMEMDFQLSALPRQLGRSVYQLMAIREKDTLENEKIPFETLPARNLNVFILASSPGFETKFLSQWLSRQGFGVVLRTQISRNKFETSSLNSKRLPTGNMTSNFLNSIDLVIGDALALSALSGAELSVIRKQVEEGGMGLIVRSDSLTRANTWYVSPFKITPAVHIASGSLGIRPGESNGKLYPIMTNQAVFVQPETGTQAWALDSSNRIIAGSSLAGKGRKVLVTLGQTYPWVLSGNEEAYADFWSQLVEKAARQSPSGGDWVISPQFPIVDEEISVHREATGIIEPIITLNEVEIAMAQDPLLPNRWNGKFWAGKEGWQATLPRQGEIDWWWAYNKNDWQPLRWNSSMKETRDFILNNHVISESSSPGGAETPLPRIFSFLLFLLSCGFLWIESKRYGERN